MPRVPTVEDVPARLLLGSGPSPVPERILRALAHPTVGHLDPAFGALQDDVAALLRATMKTTNKVTFPLSATGSGGMQAMVDTLGRTGRAGRRRGARRVRRAGWRMRSAGRARRSSRSRASGVARCRSTR